ncbi:MAG: hypothetical protein ACE5FH_03320 [Candidatus Zixiibacteriota bacterium]
MQNYTIRLWLLAKSHISGSALVLLLIVAAAGLTSAQGDVVVAGSLYDVPPRWLVDMPTAGTLPRGFFQIGTRIYPGGGAIGFTDIGLSNRLMIGVSYGGENIIANDDPNWNPSIEFSLRFRFVDEQDYFPAITGGFSSQGSGAWSDDDDRYTFKSRGFYAVVSRSFFFYQWTAGWHAGINISREDDGDGDQDLDFFGGVDATFKYNLALTAEYDAGLNDDRSTLPNGKPNSFGGKGRGYLNMGIKWLFTENLELELLLKDLFVNRRDSRTFTRELRLTYLDSF